MTTCNLMASETRTRPWAGVADAAVRVGSDPGALITLILFTA